MTEHRKPTKRGPWGAAVVPSPGSSIQRNWDKAESIHAELKQYPQRCIGPFETAEEAQRYAGKAELAAQLLGRFWPTNAEEDE